MPDSSSTKSVSRRGFVKWAGALAAAGVVGVGLGFGGDLLIRPSTTTTEKATETAIQTNASTATVTATKTNTQMATQTQTASTTVTQPTTETATKTNTQTVTTTSIQQPVTLSYVPPLSPVVQDRVNAITQQLIAMHQGEQIFYSCCSQNGCSSNCLLKVHVKNGVITAIESDDTINPNLGREDDYLTDDAIKTQMVQLRPCPKGRSWRKDIYAPTRILYPMKLVGAKGPGAKFVRISWDEATTIFANELTYMKQKYGPYSVSGFRPISSYQINGGDYIGLGLKAWGNQSTPAYAFSEQVCFGKSGQSTGDANANFLNSKLIVLWGDDPLSTRYSEGYYLLLAKKKGIPIISIDPVLTWSAQTFASQWIPIRPFTDSAMCLALANVLFKENLYDATFVSKFVEPTGFAKWKDYVQGNTAGPDGAIDRTPEWAEPICGVPAATIRAFAELYAKSKPTDLRFGTGMVRKLGGENDARFNVYLQAMTGNIGVSGGFSGGNGMSGGVAYLPAPTNPIDVGKTTPPSPNPTLANSNEDHNLILLRDKLDSGQMSINDYNAEIGNPNPSTGTPNIHMYCNMTSPYSYDSGGNNTTQNTYDINSRIQALRKAEFVAVSVRHSNGSNTWYSDLVLPYMNQFFEGILSRPWLADGHYGNYFIFDQKIINPPGEVRDNIWIDTQISAKLGLTNQVYTKLRNVSDAQWDQTLLNICQTSYQTWVGTTTAKSLVPNPPAWNDFLKKPIIRIPNAAPNVAFWDNIQSGTKWPTKSGLIEFYSDAVAAGPGPQGLIIGGMNFGKGFVPPMAEYIVPSYSFLGAKSQTYPLLMMTPHSPYRQHSAQDSNPWLNDEYRHACWLNPADAKARGIKDNDLVHVFNDTGEIILPAYVTSTITPGVTIVRFGAWYVPSNMKTAKMPDGIDMRGACNFLIPNDRDGGPVGIDYATAPVQVEKFSASTITMVTTTT